MDDSEREALSYLYYIVAIGCKSLGPGGGKNRADHVHSSNVFLGKKSHLVCVLYVDERLPDISSQITIKGHLRVFYVVLFVSFFLTWHVPPLRQGWCEHSLLIRVSQSVPV